MNSALEAWLDELESVAVADEADQPQFDILYQLRQILDPTGTRGLQEASIRDGRGRAVHGSRSSEGSRVDLHYRTGSGGRMNLEVDLDAESQRQHQRGHLAAMQRAYETWVAGGRRGKNPLEGVGSVFVSAQRPTRQGTQGRVTSVRQVQYRAGRDGRVRQVTTGRLNNPSGLPPRTIANQSIFTNLARPRPVRSARFDTFWDTAFN
jgi:hypothetical protein